MTRSTALIIALVIAGGALAAVLLVNGGGGSGDTSTVAPLPSVTATSTSPVTTTTSSKPDSVQVEATVTSYVSAAEEGDATAVCSLQVGGQGSGATSVQACASKAGIDLRNLPALAGLKVKDVRVSGDSATAQVGRFGTFRLRKSSGQWKVAGFSPSSSAGDRGSGSTRSASGGSAPTERSNPGGVQAPSNNGGTQAP